MLKSKWNTFVGMAVTSIETQNQKDLYVLCPEALPFVSGSGATITEGVETRRVSVKRADGSTYNGKINLSQTLYCTYMGDDTNRSIPDVHNGEQVIVHNYDGTDVFYWSPMDRDDSIRETEHIRWSVADLHKVIKDLNDDNTYYFEMDTKYKKKITISTSNSDGEKYRYFVIIDAVANTVEIKDDSGNFLLLDSNVPRWKIQNRDLTMIDMWKKNINIYALENIELYAGKHFFIETPYMKSTITDKYELWSTNLISNNVTGKVPIFTNNVTGTLAASVGLFDINVNTANVATMALNVLGKTGAINMGATGESGSLVNIGANGDKGVLSLASGKAMSLIAQEALALTAPQNLLTVTAINSIYKAANLVFEVGTVSGLPYQPL